MLRGVPTVGLMAFAALLLSCDSAQREVVRRLPDRPDLSRAAAAVAQAVTDADRSARSSPSGETVGRLGMTYQANAFDDAARAAYALAHELDARDPRWPYYAGVLELMVGDNTRAIADLESAVACDPRLASAWVRLGELHFASGDAGRAEEAFRRGLALDPTNPHGSVGLARILGDRGAWSEAAAQLETSMTAHPVYGPGHRVLAQAFRELGREADAKRHDTAGSPVGLEIDDALMRELYRLSSTASVLVMQAKIAETWGDGDRAEGLLRRAVAVAPEDRDARWALGRLLLTWPSPKAAKERLAESRTHLEAAMRLGPPHLNLRHDYAMAAAALGDVEEAIREWRSIVEQEPEHAMAQMSLGQVAELRQDYAGAIAHYRRGLAVAHDTPYALDDRARAYQRYVLACFHAGRADEGVTAFREAARTLPADPELRFAFGNQLLKLERFAEARAELARARELDANDPRSAAALGFVMLRLGDAAGAVRQLEDAVRLKPDFAAAHYQLGRALLARGDRAEATRHLDLARSLDPRMAEQP
jgi:tetratricopeptide (TPR) repeat protein